jgi:flagellar hook-associated protein 3 FlgL
MRVSTNLMFQTSVARLGDLQSAMDKTMRQVSSGTRVLTPADDAVAAARALDVSQAQAVNQQYGVNRQNAKTSLNQVEGTLQGVTLLLQNVKTTIVAAGGGSLSDSDRASIATELQGRFDELLGLANATDGAGNYLFSGYQSTTAPFSKTNAGAQYQGDSGRQQLQVDAARTMEISASGQEIFQGGASGADLFKTLQGLITTLATPVAGDAAKQANLSAVLASANGNIDQGLDNVLTVRASVGARLNEIDALDDTGGARDIQYQQTLSDLVGLDPVEAYSRLMQQKTTLEAAQKAYVATSGLSLFQYM